MWKIRLEFKVEDMWIGIFWKRNRPDIWICFIPMFPVHVWNEEVGDGQGAQGPQEDQTVHVQ